MKEIIAHQMQYIGGKITSNIVVVNYRDIYYEDYKAIYNDCFRPMRLSLELSPDCCSTKEQLIEKQSDIYLLIVEGDIVASVAIYGNEIDDLIVNPKYQEKGYGKQLLLYAINNLQNKGKEPICLHVAAWNKKAIGLYLNNGFKCIKTEKVK